MSTKFNGQISTLKGGRVSVDSGAADYDGGWHIQHDVLVKTDDEVYVVATFWDEALANSYAHFLIDMLAQ